ncbi:hypothetical protein DS2_04925 [Catenovulum agarivorans DS-2]|uniref:DUF4397 domain-containing protein n=1 Tax=Catenovulum agarivorans DS-2 TaxID=1328313 RepID=W7QQC2_9ALTE|nr:hypothetical protein [Catenovulum agarivorans]EWH11172.1 hypothetical protein DS2_04925 [Catenovulum agarivorans DS-2]
MNIRNVGWSALFSSAVLLTGCGGSGSNESNSTSYLTYYNLSANTAVTKLYHEDTLRASVAYQGKSTRQSVEAGTKNVQLRVDESDDVTTTLYDEDLNLAQDKRNYLISVGDLDGDNGDAPLLFTYNIINSNDLDDDKFEFNLMHLALKSAATLTVDVIDKDSGELVDTLTAEYGKSVTKQLDTDRYYFTVEDSSENLLYTSSGITFGSSQFYFALVDTQLNGEDKLTMVFLPDSTSSVTEYKDPDLKSYFRVYNSAEAFDGNTLTLEGGALENQKVEYPNIKADDLADSSFELEQGSYSLSLEGSNIVKALYSFASGVDRTVVFYRDDEGNLDDVSFTNTSRPDTTNHQITFVNLLNNQGDDEVDLYFVAPNANFATTAYRLTQRELGNVARMAVPSNTYDIYVAVDDGDGAPKVVAQQLGVKFSSDESAGDKTGDWVLIAEPAQDTDTPDQGGVSTIRLFEM